MAATGRVKAWKTIFDNNQALPVAFDRQKDGSDGSIPFCFSVKLVDGIPPRAGKSVALSGYRVNVSLFDLTYKQFFGRTWTGPVISAKVSGQKTKLNYNQSLYFHSSLNDTSIVAVVEVVGISISTSKDGVETREESSCGWGFFHIFKYEGEMTDSASSGGPTQKINLYHGTPRALLYLDEPILGNKNLSPINGCQLSYTIQTHRNLQRAMHLIPENILVSNADVIPGIVEGSRDPKNPTDALRKPRLLKSLPCFIEKINILLMPNIEKLEEDLCMELNDDRRNRENRPADGTTLVVQERRLQVGVHNGWCYVDKPEVIQLQTEAGTGGKGNTLRKAKHQRMGSTGSVGSGASALIHKNRVDLDGMVEDPAFTIVFVLEYILGEPRASSKDRRASMVKASSFNIAVRWAAWCPIANLEQSEHTLQFTGGPTQLPDSLFVYRQLSEAVGSSSSVKPNNMGGTISFSFVTSKLEKQKTLQQTGPASLSIPTLNLPPDSARTGGLGYTEDGELQGIQVSGRPPVPSSRHGTAEAGDSDSLTGVPPPDHGQSWTSSKFSSASHFRPPLQETPAQKEHEKYKYAWMLHKLHPKQLPGSQMMGYYDGGQATPHMGMSGGMGMMYPPPSQMYGHPAYATSPSPMMGSMGMGGMPSMHSYQQSPRGYLPVEIQHVTDAMHPMASRAENLQELPFTPVHAPIMATVPGQMRGPGLSRASYAKLFTAGFPPISDHKGETPEVVDPSDQFTFIMAKEEVDRLQANEIVMQFLAFSKRLGYESIEPNQQPGTVFFTFQFYRFPQVTTERLLLGKVESGLSNDAGALPSLLQKLDKDGSVMKGPPGYQVKYSIDPGYLKPGEARFFIQYLAQQTLHIDVWDGDSLMLLGSCAVELKHLCRQGKESVQTMYELDVISTEYTEDDVNIPVGDPARDGFVKPMEVRQVVRGRLHLRLANIGHPLDPNLTKGERVSVKMKPKVVVTPDSQGLNSYLGGSLNAINAHTAETRKVCKAMHMTEVNQELTSVLFAKKERKKSEELEESSGMDGTSRNRKIARMHAIRQMEGETAAPVISNFRAEKDARARDLKTISMYRDQSKREGIQSMLSHAITTEHTIHPSLGTSEFFEFTLQNPYNVQHTVSIDCNDPELKVITDPREWRHFKMLYEIYTSVEEGMFNEQTSSGLPEVFLRPKEKIHIPFKFLTFKADHSVAPQAPPDPFRSQPKRPNYSQKRDDPADTRIIRVTFKTAEGKPVGVLALKVEPQPHIVDQTFRFHHPEQSFLKKNLRLPPLHSLPGVPVGGPGAIQVLTRCSDANVICESRKVQAGEPHDIFVKVACGPSPQIKKFFIAMYTDQFLARPIQIWQFYVHALQRVDVAGTEGQTSRFTLMLRGTQASRLVQAYSSEPMELAMEPKDAFMLAANGLQEIHVGVRPQHAGTKFLYIHIVDIEYHQLIRTWLVCIMCRPPMVTKVYELEMPIGGGVGSNKRISYTNSYQHRKVFHIRSNNEALLQFKETRMDIAAGEKYSIGLRFAPNQSPGTIDFLVFINDEDDQNEETFCIKATYK